MTPRDFAIWMHGFVEACNEFHPTPKQWDRIKEVLEDVEVDEYLGMEIEDFEPDESEPFSFPLTGSCSTPASGKLSSLSYTVSSGSTSNIVNSVIWNDKMGCWHYTNYPEGFGYYHNSQDKKEKQLLND